MQTHPAFKALMDLTITVQEPTVVLSENREPQLDEFTEITGSPVTGTIQPIGGAARDDFLFPQWPEATHVMFCAVGVTLKPGYLVSWSDPESVTRYAYIEGPPEDEGGRAHHYRVPLKKTHFLPTGVS